MTQQWLTTITLTRLQPRACKCYGDF